MEPPLTEYPSRVKRTCSRRTTDEMGPLAPWPALHPRKPRTQATNAACAASPPITKIPPAAIQLQTSPVTAAMGPPPACIASEGTHAHLATSPAAAHVLASHSSNLLLETGEPAPGSAPQAPKPAPYPSQKQVLDSADAYRRRHSERIDLYAQLVQAGIRASEAISAAVHVSIGRATPGMESDAMQRQVAKCRGHVDGLGCLADMLEAWLDEYT